jgi:hypothetical protein
MLLRVIKLMPSPMIEVVDCFVRFIKVSGASFVKEGLPAGAGPKLGLSGGAKGSQQILWKFYRPYLRTMAIIN